MTPDLKCTKCNGQMLEGLVVDFNYTGAMPSMWVEEKTQAGASNMMNGKRKVKTVTYRCSDCGYLDSYAK